MKPTAQPTQASIYLTYFLIMIGLKQGDTLMPLLFNSTIDYAISRDQVNREGLKLNGTQQLLVYDDDDNILVGSILTIKKNTESLVVANKQTGIDVKTDKTKYMVIS